MKILYVALEHELVNDKTTGYNVHMSEVIDELNRNGVTVSIHMRKMWRKNGSRNRINSTKINSRINTNKSTVSRIIKNTIKDARILVLDLFIEFPRILKKLNSGNYAAVYERTSYMSYAVALASLFCNKSRYLMEINAPYYQYIEGFGKKSLISNISLSIERFQHGRCNKAFVISRVLLNHYRDIFGFPESKYVVHHMAARSVLEYERRKFDKNESFKLCFLGSIFKWSGIENLLKVISDLAKTGKCIELYIIGGGSYLGELHCSNPDLFTSSIRVIGWIDDSEINELLKNYHLGVIPKSNWFGSSTKLFRFGSLGLPVLAPRNNVFDEELRFDRFGLMSSGDISELKDVIIGAMNDYDSLNDRAEKFAQFINQNHLWKHRVRDILNEIK